MAHSRHTHPVPADHRYTRIKLKSRKSATNVTLKDQTPYVNGKGD